MSLKPVLFLLAVCCVTQACQQPCDRLDERASDCGVLLRSGAHKSSQACLAAHDYYGRAALDDYATCLSDLSCQDGAGLLACGSDLAKTDDSACTRYSLWAIACGLEPAAISDNCSAYQGIESSARFALWVDCMTAEACPDSYSDERFYRCDNHYLGDAAPIYLDACQLIAEFNQRCFELEIGTAACVLEGQLYTPTSYLAYAQCLAQQECQDQAGQLACGQLRQTPSSQHAQSACENILAWAQNCGVNAAVGSSLEACMSTLARFTTASLAAYETCITQLPCEQASAAALCVELLEIETTP